MDSHRRNMPWGLFFVRVIYFLEHLQFTSQSDDAAAIHNDDDSGAASIDSWRQQQQHT